ncbi:glycosyltransferase family 4 protein, partial [bacterium]|nr:glycosyltransferase family 4 protein [bacterium]
RTFNIEKKLPAHYKKRNKFLKGLIYVQSLFKILLYIIRKKPDIVHFQQLKIPSLETVMYALIKKSGCKIVLTLHNVLPFENTAVSPFYKHIYRIADRIIVHSEKNIPVIQKHPDKADRQKFTVIHHGDCFLLSRPVDRKEARELLGIEAEKKVLLFFGYIRRYKGLDILLDTLTIVKETHPEAVLLIAGEEVEEFGRYDKIIDTLNLEKFILKKTDYIPLEEQSIYFSAADVVVLPYRHVYQSGVVFLAYAHSRVVVGTEVGGLPEVIENGKSGFIIPPGNPEALAERIDYLFSNPGVCTQMGDYGKKMTEQRFSWESAAQKTHQLYNEIM